jgi:hypothetical protein
MPWSGEWARGRELGGALERGGDSPEGAPSPRARRRFARGRVRPSSEAEISWLGTWPSSEVEISWLGAWPSSEAEVRPRGTEADRSMCR